MKLAIRMPRNCVSSWPCCVVLCSADSQHCTVMWKENHCSHQLLLPQECTATWGSLVCTVSWSHSKHKKNTKKRLNGLCVGLLHAYIALHCQYIQQVVVLFEQPAGWFYFIWTRRFCGGWKTERSTFTGAQDTISMSKEKSISSKYSVFAHTFGSCRLQFIYGPKGSAMRRNFWFLQSDLSLHHDSSASGVSGCDLYKQIVAYWYCLNWQLTWQCMVGW